MACIDSGSKLVMRITDHLSEMCSSQKHIQAHQSIRRASLALPREQLLSGQFVRIAFFFFPPFSFNGWVPRVDSWTRGAACSQKNTHVNTDSVPGNQAHFPKRRLTLAWLETPNWQAVWCGIDKAVYPISSFLRGRQRHFNYTFTKIVLSAVANSE